MKAEIKQRWVAALRSGDYKQGCGELYNPNEDTYCCLGVLCVVNGIQKDEIQFEEYPAPDVVADLGLPDTYGTLPDSHGVYWESLVDANDADVSFSEIADIIEKQF